MDNKDFETGNLAEAQVDKREERRKRRVRNQIMAYVSLVVMILVLAGGCVFSIKYITERAQANNTVPGVEEQLENILETETAIQEPDSSDFVPELTEEERLDELVNAAIEVMPLEDKVAGLFVVTPEDITGVSKAVKAGEGTKEALAQYAVGGIIYFGQNIQSQEQLQEMISNTILYSRYPIYIAVDEEGGSVSRIAQAGLGTKIDPASKIGATADASKAYEAGTTIANDLSSFGFNLNFAPVADIHSMEDSIIGDRAYGSDSTIVASMVSSMVQGLQEHGVSACLKHFPGIGSSTEDTHDVLAETERTAEDFRGNEFTVFQAGIDAGADFVMMAHMAAPALSGDKTQCSLSKIVVTDILRGELGFEGVIISDALNMSAITEYYLSDEAAIMAIKAGCDMLLMPEDFELAYNAVLLAVQEGTISEERVDDSLRRIYRIKYADKLGQ